MAGRYWSPVCWSAGRPARMSGYRPARIDVGLALPVVGVRAASCAREAVSGEGVRLIAPSGNVVAIGAVPCTLLRIESLRIESLWPGSDFYRVHGATGVVAQGTVGRSCGQYLGP